MLELEQMLPEKPPFDEEDIERVKGGGDSVPIMHNWTNYVVQLCSVVTCIEPCSPGTRELPELHRAILAGLLNRCAHLGLSVLKLSSEDKHGETVGILQRCICEAATNVMWLCRKDTPKAFDRYLADGLRTDLVFRDQILKSISDRGGAEVVIEKRMLGSIDRCVKSTGMREEQILDCPRLPGLHDRLVAVGLEWLYTAGFRMGAHWVHGTWTDLRRHYVAEEETGRYRMRCFETRVHSNQLMMTSLVIILALQAYVDYVCLENGSKEFLQDILAEAKDRIAEIDSLSMGNDFEVDAAGG